MSEAQVISNALADVVERAGASVVRIDARCNGASGVVWSADGVIVTAHHALERDEGLTVTLHDGRTLEARVLGRDPGTDLAVLKVDATDLTPMTWSDGSALRVGNFIVALGRPGRTVRASFGIVGALGGEVRTHTGARLDRYIECDANLPRGFSGGPLMDLSGAALGLNTAGLLRGGATVPTATLARVVTELVTHGRTPKGYLGVGIHPVRLPGSLAERVKQRGAVVLVSVEGGSAAESAGMLVGDLLVSLGGRAVEGVHDLNAALEGRAGQTVTAVVVRAGEPKELSVTPAARP